MRSSVRRRARATFGDAAAYREALSSTGGAAARGSLRDWAEARRQSVRETALALLVELGGAQNNSAAIETLRRAVVEDP